VRPLQSFAVRFPAYTSATGIPETWRETATQNRTVFKLRSSHWVFNLVSNLVYTRYSDMASIVQARIVREEAKLARSLAQMDAKALSMLKAGQEKAVIVAALTQFTKDSGDGLVDTWVQFFGELFVRFSDGFDAHALPRAPPVAGAPAYTPGGTATVKVGEGGYDKTWYSRIAADVYVDDHGKTVKAGEKYRVPASVGEVIDPRLSTDRLKYL